MGLVKNKHQNQPYDKYKPGVSNLFDWRAKCKNFKLVGGQTTDQDAEGVEGGMGRGVPLPSQLGVWGSIVSSQVRSGTEPQQKTSFGIF